MVSFSCFSELISGVSDSKIVLTNDFDCVAIVNRKQQTIILARANTLIYRCPKFL